MSTGETEGPKPLFWIGSSRKDLKAFPPEVRQAVGYALHAFQKKSKKGIKTPLSELEIVRKRLKEAEEHHAKRRAEEERRRRPGHH
jgi:phage-related protein